MPAFKTPDFGETHSEMPGESAMIRPQTCPVCNGELPPDAGSNSGLFPFCSKRCRQIDLLRWCDGRYAIVEPLDPQFVDPDTQTDNSLS